MLDSTDGHGAMVVIRKECCFMLRVRFQSVLWGLLIPLGLSIAISSPVFSKSARMKQLLEDANIGIPPVRKAALMRCGVDRIMLCYRSLLRALKESDIEVQGIVARSLARLQERKSIQPLKEAIRSLTPRIQKKQEEINALLKSGEKPVELYYEQKTLEKLYSAKAGMILAIGSMRQASESSYLMEFLKEEEPLIRSTSAVVLSYIPDKANQKPLEDYLANEKEEIVKVQLLRALLNIDRFNFEYIDSFLDILFSDDPHVRASAARLGARFQIREGRNFAQRAIAIEDNDDVLKEMEKYYRSIIYY